MVIYGQLTACGMIVPCGVLSVAVSGDHELRSRLHVVARSLRMKAIVTSATSTSSVSTNILVSISWLLDGSVEIFAIDISVSLSKESLL
eukprot:scaffold7734_cov145-Skeletonema_menzelii.AAC.1